MKEEFAPSDRAAISKQQQAASNLLTPHMRLLQFLGSHFNSTRLGSPHTEKVFLRLLNLTLDGVKHATGHPSTRELRLHIVFFALGVLRHSISLTHAERTILRDRILSAGLTWFSFSPRWSFGANKLQVKAERRLLTDIASSLHNIKAQNHRFSTLTKAITAKETLLLTLLESEQARLTTWLNPLGEAGAMYGGINGSKAQAEVCNQISNSSQRRTNKVGYANHQSEICLDF